VARGRIDEAALAVAPGGAGRRSAHGGRCLVALRELWRRLEPVNDVPLRAQIGGEAGQECGHCHDEVDVPMCGCRADRRR